MSTVIDRPLRPHSEVRAGSFRRFGAYGPVYEIVVVNPDQTARIRVLESGEEFDYPIQKIVEDDEA